MLHPKAEAMQAFLKRGGSICSQSKPAAEHGQIDYHVLPFEQATATALRPLLAKFFAPETRKFGTKDYRACCLFIDEPDFVDRTQEQARAFAMREELVLAMQSLMHAGTAIETLRKQVRGLLDDPMHKGVLAPRCMNYGPVMFTMGPGYDEQFRRFAPHTCIPITVTQDVDEMAARFPERDFTAETHAEARRRNRDDLMILKFYEQ